MRFLVIILILLTGINVSLFAQKSEVFWFCPSAEIALYSEQSFSYGGGFVIAYGKNASIGLKGAYFLDEQKVSDVLELNVLFRLHLLKEAANRGPFFQLTGGPAIFFPRDLDIILPAKIGMFSASIGFGWRFLFGKTFFIEPQVRGGYPFIAGASLSAGFKF